MKSTRRRIHEIVDPAEGGDVASVAFDALIVVLICLDVTAFILNSVEGYAAKYALAFMVLESFVLAVFVVDYLLRMWSCVEDARYGRRWGRLRFARTPMAIIDLIAVLPVLTLIPGIEIPPEMTAFRIFRVLRMGKLIRYFETVHVLGRSVWRARRELGTIVVALVMLILVSSLLIYRFEKGEENPAIDSIPDAMWWSVVTMSTVGYGDVIPQTVAGRIVAGILMVCGIGMFALPAGLLGAAFTEEMRIQHERRRRRREKRTRKVEHILEERLEATEEKLEAAIEARLPAACPHCGKSLAAKR